MIRRVGSQRAHSTMLCCRPRAVRIVLVATSALPIRCMNALKAIVPVAIRPAHGNRPPSTIVYCPVRRRSIARPVTHRLRMTSTKATRTIVPVVMARTHGHLPPSTTPSTSDWMAITPRSAPPAIRPATTVLTPATAAMSTPRGTSSKSIRRRASRTSLIVYDATAAVMSTTSEAEVAKTAGPTMVAKGMRTTTERGAPTSISPLRTLLNGPDQRSDQPNDLNRRFRK